MKICLLQMAITWRAWLAVIGFMVLMTCSSSAYPVVGRRAPEYGYYPLERPAQCKFDKIYDKCFPCGKILDSIPLYNKCCEGGDIFNYCQEIITK